MARIQFEDGKIVEFDGVPTANDIAYVESQIYGNAKSKSQPEPQSMISKASNFVSNPLIPIKKIGANILDATSKLTGAGADRGIIKTNLPIPYGMMKSAAGKAEGLTTPTNIGLIGGMALAPPIAATIAAGTFTLKSLYDLFKNAPEKYSEYKYALAKGDTEKQAEIVTDAGFDVGMTGLVGRNFLKELPSISPFRNPSLVMKGMESTAKGLSEPSMNSEQIGQGIQRAYNEKTGSFINKLTEPAPEIPSTPYIPKTGEEILTTEFNKVAKQISPESVTAVQSGKIFQKGRLSKLKDLKSIESSAYKVIEEKLKDSSGFLTNTVDYIKNLFGIGEKGLGQGNILGETNQAGIPISIIRQQYPDYTPPIDIKTIEEANPGLPARDYVIFNKVLRVGQKENLTANDIKQLKTAVGQRIDWNAPRGDELNYNLINLFKNLGKDYTQTAEAHGFGKEAATANQASKNVYTYLEQPSTEIIGKADYPEDLPEKLIKADSPTRIKELFTEHGLSEMDKNMITREVLDRMFNDSGKDPVKFSKILKTYDPEVKKTLFGKNTDLVDSLANTTKTMAAEIAKAKASELPIPSAKVPSKSEILSINGKKIDDIMSKTDASKLVDELMKNGTPEMARIVRSTLGKDGSKLLERGIINRIIEKSQIRGDNGQLTIDPYQLKKELTDQKLNPNFINDMFPENANLINGLKDTSQFYERKMNEYGYTPYSPVRIAGISARMFNYIKNIIKIYRIPAQTANMLEKAYGPEISKQIVPFEVPAIHKGFSFHGPIETPQKNSDENP